MLAPGANQSTQAPQFDHDGFASLLASIVQQGRESV